MDGDKPLLCKMVVLSWYFTNRGLIWDSRATDVSAGTQNFTNLDFPVPPRLWLRAWVKIRGLDFFEIKVRN